MTVGATEKMQAERKDRFLIQQIAAGDEAAFATFYRSYEKRLYGFIHQKLSDPFEVSDLLHIVFMEVWKNAARFEGNSKVSTWLFSIAYRKVVDRLRKKIPEPRDIDEEVAEVTSHNPSAFDLVSAREEAEHLRTCLGRLKAVQRTVLELAFFEEMRYGEIAEVMGCPEGTVKTRIMHAKSALLSCVSDRTGRR